VEPERAGVRGGLTTVRLAATQAGESEVDCTAGLVVEEGRRADRNAQRGGAMALSENEVFPRPGDGGKPASSTPAARNYIGAKTSWIEFGEGTRAFLALPERAAPPFAAVILGHERYGLVQHTQDLAAKFASYGYACVAPDMASHWDGDKAALNRGEARLSLSDPQIRYYMGKSLDYLAALPQVNAKRIAAMGVCQSGGYPLLLNSVRSEIAANLVFYGGESTSEEVIAALSAPVLGIWGEKDHVISLEGVRRFRDLLEKHNKSYDFRVFAGMPHGWLNDTMPGRYRQREAEAAWSMMIDFLERVFAGAYPPQRVRQRFEADVAADYDFGKNVRLE
jgi:carboxymethylenebutenolidase